LNYADANDMVKILPKMLSSIGSVDVGLRRVADAGGSNRTNLVVVTDIPEAVDRVAEFLAAYDKPLPQIMIEAKFVETTVSATDIYGIEWKLGIAANAGISNIGTENSFPLMLGPYQVGRLDYSGLSAALSFLQTRGNSRMLANPSTLTLDNHTAIVSMGTDVPIQEVSSDPKTGLVVATWRTRSVPIKLEVTPHVTSDGQVNMKVLPSVEAITGWVGSSDNQRPIVSRQSADVDIAVGDGEVAVIGGLTRDEETRTIGKIPLLGDIPILGHLFRKTTINHTKNELIIFIIPHVVPPEVESSQRPEKYFVD
jgi:type II secretory pathway component GspD/PulD (secretin)